MGVRIEGSCNWPVSGRVCKLTRADDLVLIGRQPFDTVGTEVYSLHRHTVIEAQPLTVHTAFGAALLRLAAFVLDFLLRFVDIALGCRAFEQPSPGQGYRTDVSPNEGRTAVFCTPHSGTALQQVSREARQSQQATHTPNSKGAGVCD